MASLDALVTEIRGELRSSASADNVKVAIAASIDWFRSRRLRFNELKFTFSTIAAQEYYDDTDDDNIPLIAKIDSAVLNPGSNESDLDLVNSDFIDSRGYTTGDPERVAYIRESLRLHPVPTSVKSIRIDGVLELIDSAQSTADQRLLPENVLTIPGNYSSRWFKDGKEIIKAWAKGYVYLHNLRNSTEAKVMFEAAEAFASRSAANAQASSSDMTIPTQF